MSDTVIAVCERCAKSYAPQRPWQRFCSTACRWVTWNKVNQRLRAPNCARCGHAFERRTVHQRFCSPRCRKNHWAALRSATQIVSL